MNVLIVEDDKVLRNMFTLFLKPYCKVYTAINGNDSLTLIKQFFDEGNPFELILLDIMLPELDGISVLKEIRKYEQKKLSYKKAIVIMITALCDHKNVYNSFSEDCNGYLVKPISKKILLKILLENNIRF